MSISSQVGAPTITIEQIDRLANDNSTLDDMGLDGEVVSSDVSVMAEEEQRSIGNRDLEVVSRDNQHKRDEDWKTKFDNTFKRLFFLLACLFALMVIALISHWILPESLHWLSESQVGRLETVVIAVLVSKAVTVRQGKIE